MNYQKGNVLKGIVIFLIIFFLNTSECSADDNSPLIATFKIYDECTDNESVLQYVKTCIENASEKGAAFVVLPFFADIFGDDIIDEISIESQTENLWIIFGAKQRIAYSDETYHTVFTCEPNGNIKTYQNLYSLVGPCGDSTCVVETPFGMVGIAGEDDLYYVPELSRYYSAIGCRVILNPRLNSDYDWWTKSIEERDGVVILETYLQSESEKTDSIIEMSTYRYKLDKVERSDVNNKKLFQDELYYRLYNDVADDLPIEDETEYPIPNIRAVDFTATWGSIEDNVNKMKKEIQNAYEDAIDMIVFPEMCLQGYSNSKSSSSIKHKNAYGLSVSKDSECVKEIAKLAVDYNMYILFGASETAYDEKGKKESKAYNSAFICCPNGEVVTYRKIHSVEGTWCQNGTEPCIVQTEYGKIGIGICKDTYSYPELSRYYAGKGCKYYINLTASLKDGELDWKDYYLSRLKMIADSCNMVVVSSNLKGTQRSKEGISYGNFPGMSCVIYPDRNANKVKMNAHLFSDMYAVILGEKDFESLELLKKLTVEEGNAWNQPLNLDDFRIIGQEIKKIRVYSAYIEEYNPFNNLKAICHTAIIEPKLIQKVEISGQAAYSVCVFKVVGNNIKQIRKTLSRDGTYISFPIDETGIYVVAEYCNPLAGYRLFQKLIIIHPFLNNIKSGNQSCPYTFLTESNFEDIF